MSLLLHQFIYVNKLARKISKYMYFHKEILFFYCFFPRYLDCKYEKKILQIKSEVQTKRKIKQNVGKSLH